MSAVLAWLSTLVTIAVLVAYETVLMVAQRRRPERMARSAHAALREDWFIAVSQNPGSEILAVQTLRNIADVGDHDGIDSDAWIDRHCHSCCTLTACGLG
ncbi:DUF599 family protein [Variovorax sp. PAMC28562]|uniref:DUF599 family protein n=1 Tax=Variovorax sp. PAMC28562 TaxID=2762323 RepID=UPI0028FCC4D3|nr:DUF599 family protein [Variovorax sp. PAMC28562]